MRESLVLLVAAMALAPEGAVAQCERDKLTISDGEAFDKFGDVIAIEGDWAAVAARDDATQGLQAGSAYMLLRNQTGWIEFQKILPLDLPAYRFGIALDIEFPWLVIGASSADNEDGLRTGAAYLFRLQAGQWVERQKLTPKDAIDGALFGSSVSLNGTTLVVGATERGDGNPETGGAAYVFQYDSGSDAWFHEATLRVENSRDQHIFDFGQKLDLQGDELAVKANQFLVSEEGDGMLDIYRLEGEKWTLQQRIFMRFGVDDAWGSSVAFAGDWLGVGTHRDRLGNVEIGSVRLFRRNSSTGQWELFDRIRPPDGEWFDQFGLDIDLAGNDLIVGASGEDPGGAVYHYKFMANQWVLQNRMTVSDSSGLGWAVAFQNDAALFGDPGNDNKNGNSAGAVYIFDLECGEFATLDSINVAFGQHISGGLQHILESDDSFFRARSRFGVTALEANVVDIRINATSVVANPNSIDLIIEGRLNQTGGTTRVRLRDWTQSGTAFETVHAYSIGNQERSEFIENVPNGADYMRDSDGRVQLSLRQSVMVTFSAVGFDSFLDFVSIEVEE